MAHHSDVTPEMLHNEEAFTLTITVDDVMEHCPGLTREQAKAVLDYTFGEWKNAQQHINWDTVADNAAWLAEGV